MGSHTRLERGALTLAAVPSSKLKFMSLLQYFKLEIVPTHGDFFIIIIILFWFLCAGVAVLHQTVQANCADESEHI